MVKGKTVGVILDKKDIEKFIESLAERYRIFCPSQKDGGDSFIEIDSPDKIKYDYSNTKISPKGLFFPQTENLFFFDANKNKVKCNESNVDTQNKHSLLFGTRPCDAMAITYLDRVFKENNMLDTCYEERRNSTRIISFACTHPHSTCFCTSVRCGPDSEIGSDIIFFELNGRYLIKSITPEGKDILKNAEDLLKPIASNDLQEKAQSMLLAKSKLKKIFELERLKKKLDNFDAPYWETLHQKCLGCGICTYLCPTCHCFDITDEVVKSYGRRVRTWDSCMFSLFTLHASGHNPRPTQKERMRQRIMHKFNYAQKNYNETFCVGCGRCITNCPVNMDIRKIIQEIMEVK